MVARLIAIALAVLALVLVLPSRDADRDGIVDTADRCPGTAKGDAVGADGCSPAQAALARGSAALLRAEHLLNSGTVWVAGRLSRLDPNPALQALVERSVAALHSDPSARLIDPTLPPVELPADPGRGIMRFAHYVQAPTGAPLTRAVDFLTQFLSTDEHGYVLTHQLLALLWSADQGLPLPANLVARQADLLDRMAAEQAALPRFNDLFAERTAFLLAFGAPPRADAAGWIATIVAAQQPDGRWVDQTRSTITYDGQTAPAIHEWTHTSGLAVTALWFYTHCCAGDAATCGGADGTCPDPRPPQPTPCAACGTHAS
jgi:hypothetical protein